MIAGGALASGPVAGTALSVYQGEALSQIVVASEGQAYAQKPMQGLADVAFNSKGDIIRGLTFGSLSKIQFELALDGTRGVLGDGLSEIQFEMAGDFKAAPPVSATFNLRFESTGELNTTGVTNGDGKAIVEVRSSGSEIKRNTVIPDMPMAIRFNVKGRANIRAGMPQSLAGIEFASALTLDKGAKHYGAGKAIAARFFSRGMIETRHYVYGDGAMEVSIACKDNGYGIPPIPQLFIRAPQQRTMYAPPANRTMYAPSHKRTVQ